MSDSPSQNTAVVIGGGQAGGEVALELRRAGFSGRVRLVSDEPFLPYKRPPLSKTFLSGAASQDSLCVASQASLDKHNIEFLGGVRATRIDRKAKTVELSDGQHLSYDKLALATGGRPRPLTVPGADLPGIFPLRGIADVDAIRARATPGKRLVIVGGGFIGLEVAATTIKMGLKVTVLEGLPRVLARVTAPDVSTFFERVHRQAGVDLRTSTQLTGFAAAGDALRVELAEGNAMEADLVIYGIGMLPNTELAAEAGLTVDNGIVVDEFARSSDPDIVAAGDCTNHPSAYAGRRLRLESVQNAMDQARVAARSLAGKSEAYNALPWFWSDQYDLKLQMAGLSTGHDQTVLRGDPTRSRTFALFYLKQGTLLAADAVNRQPDHLVVRKLIAAGARPDPAVLADESIPLKSLLPST